MQVHQRQHLRHLRALAAPRSQDPTAEPPPLARCLVSGGRSPWGPRPRSAPPRGDHPGPGVSITHHQSPAVLVPVIHERRQVGVPSASKAAASIRRAPSRQISSSARVIPRPRRHQRLLSTLAFLPRRRWHAGTRDWSTRKVRRAPAQMVHPQVLVIIHPSRDPGMRLSHLDWSGGYHRRPAGSAAHTITQRR